MDSGQRFKTYDISALRGKVPSIFLDNYLDDSSNIEMISFIAGLHMSWGDFDLGIRISEDIVEKTYMGEDNVKETGITVWNLYVLSKIYLEQERFDKAYRALDTAERYWSKDYVLVDDTDMYRVRNKEDLWLRRAFGYLIQGRKDDFERIADKVMLSRYELYSMAYDITKEIPIRDGCLLDCFEYSSYMYRNMEDLKQAIVFIKTATRYLGKVPIDNDYIDGKTCEKNKELKNAYNHYVRFYLSNRPQIFCETMVYGTCKSCVYFKSTDENEGICKKLNIDVDQHKACSKFSALGTKLN